MTDPRTEAEVADRKVLMSPLLMEEWATRDASGNRLSWDWGEPDADGYYTPAITRHSDDAPVENIMDALPFPTTDARKWAAEFVRLHGGDEGLMLSWFANAIEHGRGPDPTPTRETDRSEAVAALADALDVAMRGGYVVELPSELIAERLIDAGYARVAAALPAREEQEGGLSTPSSPQDLHLALCVALPLLPLAHRCRCDITGSDFPTHGSTMTYDIRSYLGADAQPPAEGLRRAAWRLAYAAESLSGHAKHPDDEGHRSWFRAAIGDVDREIGLTRDALAALDTETVSAYRARLRERVEAELALIAEEPDDFEKGAAAAYNFVLSIEGGSDDRGD